MSWLFSQALVADCLERKHLDCGQSALLNWTGTGDAFLHSDRMNEGYEAFSRYGMTFVPLTADRGAGLLILSLVDFLAKRSQQRPGDAMWRSICGPKCTEWLRR